jgi:hypothetical protein
MRGLGTCFIALSLSCGGGFPLENVGDASTDANGGTDVSTASDTATSDAPVSNCKTVPPSNNCGLDPQCGCGSQGTCDVNYPASDNGETVCVQSTGNGQIGAICSDTAQCAPGLSCWSQACRPYCTTVDAPCNVAGTNDCYQVFLPSTSTPIPNASVCGINCKLDDLYSCGGDENGCIYYTDSNGNQTDCSGLGSYNTVSCTESAPFCAPGYACLVDDTCEPWCEVDDPACAGDSQCTEFDPALIVQGIEYGVCQ